MIATISQFNNTALCTCHIEALAIGVFSILLKLFIHCLSTYFSIISSNNKSFELKF
ncbi:MAG: hypothetical protein Q8S84_00355 [bacterium]|nr:hypothetical protein [bacterium]